jgi:hypothetical protein
MIGEEELLIELARFRDDPVGFVRWAFPWGMEGTELEDRAGPEPWQLEQQIYIKDRLDQGLHIVLDATASGHGIGKSAEAAWMILWAFSTFPNMRGVVTANTEKQLKTKTWTELAKWFGLFIGKELFELDATCLKVRSTETEEKIKWKVDMVPWSERNTEAFAGMHNLGRRVLLLMDEASAIPDIIFETSEGVLTDHDTQIIWLIYGNPTRNRGRFRECFEGGKFARRWNSRRIDSREVSFTNKDQIKSWIEDYGEDSDFVRVRVKGTFPRVDAESFIPYILATDAVERDVEVANGEPLILGVDIGRFGDDPSVVAPRRGRDAVSIPWEVYYGLDTMNVASRIAAMFLRLRAHVVMIDAGGVGGGVADRLRMLNIPTLDVMFGSGADNNSGDKFANKRAEIWGALREWLKGGSIPGIIQGVEITMVDDLTAPRYGMNGRDEILLESKADMRKRGQHSPNFGDALACTFAYPVFVPTNVEDTKQQISEDYNPYELERVYA